MHFWNFSETKQDNEASYLPDLAAWSTITSTKVPWQFSHISPIAHSQGQSGFTVTSALSYTGLRQGVFWHQSSSAFAGLIPSHWTRPSQGLHLGCGQGNHSSSLPAKPLPCLWRRCRLPNVIHRQLLCASRATTTLLARCTSSFMLLMASVPFLTGCMRCP